MIADQPQTAWEVLTASVQGFSHLRSETPNQDAADARVSSEGTLPAIVIVADGHGSPKSTRSDIGSGIAVQVAMDVAQKFVGEMRGASLSQVKEYVDLGKLQARIYDGWKQKVKLHFEEHPPDEWKGSAAGLTSDATQSTGQSLSRDVPLSMYGSTLLLAILNHDYLLSLQIGDGDILAVFDTSDDAGQLTFKVKRLIPKHEENIANETDSLCMLNPVKAFRYYFQHFESQKPAMVFLSTDGYYNSFASDESYQKNCLSLLSTLHSQGIDEVRRELPTWLSEYSQEGSGDDVSVGIVFCKNSIPQGPIHDENAELGAVGDDGTSAIGTPVVSEVCSFTASELHRKADVAGQSERELIEDSEKCRERDEFFSLLDSSSLILPQKSPSNLI
jgi:serine/threonine protein phosphatase PrpC